MKPIATLSLVFMLMLSGCSSPVSSAAGETKAEKSQSEAEQTSSENKASQSQSSTLPEVTSLNTMFDIEFSYVNNIYQYDVQAKWSDVEIKAVAPQQQSGLEILLDGTTEMFSECDLDHSQTITQDEWTSYEEDVFFTVLDLNSDGTVNMAEFQHFTDAFYGIFLSPTGHSISQPNHQDYQISIEDFDPPVSLKILRAGEGGFNAGAGIVFPAGTIFVELVSEFDVVLKEMPDFELPPGFEGPLLSMYLEQDYEENNHGALGFSSIVNTEEFNGIYGGKAFTLNYEGKGESGVLDEYHLTITPKR